MPPRSDWPDGKGRLISLDFDGVIHRYDHGWQGIDRAESPPVEGVFAFISELLQAGFRVAVFSSRSREYLGFKAMASFFERHGAGHLVHAVQWPYEKPASWLHIDDRAFCFRGKFPSLEEVDRFRPWNRVAE